MLTYTAKRFAQLILTIFILTFILFILFYVLPGDPETALVPKGASKQIKQNIVERFGLDKPVYIQYFSYIKNLFQFDLGYSFYYREPVSSIIKGHYLVTLKLAFLALLFEVLIGFSLAVFSSSKYGLPTDRFLTFSFAILACIPIFWLGVLAQYVLGLKLKIFPISGVGNGEILYFVLPALAIALISSSYLFRVARESFNIEFGKTYVEAAFAKGYSYFEVIFLQIFRNALIPVATLIGMDLGMLLGGAVLTETVFNLPGIGRVAYQATLHRDLPLILGTTIVITVVFVVINFCIDIFTFWLNPKTRENYEKIR